MLSKIDKTLVGLALVAFGFIKRMLDFPDFCWVIVLMGAIVLFFSRLHRRMTVKMDVTQARLCSIGMTSAALAAAGAYCMYSPSLAAHNLWALLIAIFAAIEVYVSFRSK